MYYNIDIWCEQIIKFNDKNGYTHSFFFLFTQYTTISVNSTVKNIPPTLTTIIFDGRGVIFNKKHLNTGVNEYKSRGEVKKTRH